MSKQPLSSLNLHAPRGWCALSDLHLSEDLPLTVAQFETFCQTIAIQYDAVFILGDLFEYWVGDDAIAHHPIAQRVIEQTRQLHAQGIAVYFMCGNRDIVVKQRFCAKAQMTWLADPCVIYDTLSQQRILLSHGDLLCTDDVHYQRQRRKYTHPWLQWILLQTPLRFRLRLVQKLRAQSQQRWLALPDELKQQYLVGQDVAESAVLQWAQQYNISVLVHGHTHRPRHITHPEHPETQNQAISVSRWVLPDWDCDKPPVRWGYLSAQAGVLVLHPHNNLQAT